jgi:ABC-type transport system involved in Fe-S cluster assembly fused permease/ATPase subunit
VKSYNQEEREKKDFWENTERLRQKACNSEKITRLLPFLHDIIFNVVLLGIMVMIGVMVIKGRTAG